MLQEITDKNIWEEFSPLKERGIFLQSYPQKKLFENLGQKTWLFRNNENSIQALINKVEARRGVFLYLPYGPVLSSAEINSAKLEDFFSNLKELARQEKASFIRISPFWRETPENLGILKKLGFIKAPIHMLAETIWLLDLNKTEEELLMGMEKKHRNLVKRAEKEGVEIKKSNASEAVERFIDLHWQTMDRHNFTPYPKDYFREQVKQFAEDDQVLILEAYHQGALLATAIIMYYGRHGAYHHGASSSHPEHRKIPASYLLQWEAIKEAKKRGRTVYNFWGIAPGKNPKHPFYGITHFKSGFGGYQYDLIPCHDLVVNPKYYLTWLIEKVRKWKRGF